MSLLREIEADTLDPNVSISTILRKCTILASRLGNREFQQWIEKELNGYSSSDSLPKYRQLEVQSFGHFVGLSGRELRNAPIPSLSLPSEHRDYVTNSPMTEPISYYESLVKDSGNNQSSSPVSYWPPNLVAQYGSKIYSGMKCLNAWQLIPRSAITAVLDTVRTRILNFALEIEKEAPDAGESPINSKPVADERVSQVFQTVIQGNVMNLTAGNQNTVNTEINVTQYDFDSLKRYLSSIGVSDLDLKDLEEAVKDDRPVRGQKDFGDKVKDWLTSMFKKAGTTAWNVTITTGMTMIIKALARYYGIPC